jgi:hypothetical protein
MNVDNVDIRESYIRHSGLRNELRGLVEHVDEDGLIIRRLSVDCLFMLDIVSRRRPIKPDDFVVLTVEAFDLWLT